MHLSNPSSLPRHFPHRLLQEIYEQPQALEQTVRAHVSSGRLFPGEFVAIEAALANLKKIIIAASGSSRHAGLVGEIVIEDLAGVSVDVEYASEYCYRSTHATADPLVIVISQSGETADTVAAQREGLARGTKTVAICNVADSTLTREASAALVTYAGEEAAVPATKSFTSQLVALYLFALYLASQRGRATPEIIRNHLRRLLELPGAVAEWLPKWDGESAQIAKRVQNAKAFLCLGRGVHYPIAREAALKIKEISYVQAEGYPAGELKHGPRALVEEGVPVVMLATCDAGDPDSVLRYQKTLKALAEMKAQGVETIAIGTEGYSELNDIAAQVVFVPRATEFTLPMMEIVPLQLLAYQLGILKGRNVDNPRHLVKAVVWE